MMAIFISLCYNIKNTRKWVELIDSIKLKLLKVTLLNIKNDMANTNGRFILANRHKNVEFMRENLLTIEDVKDIIFNLKPEDYISGPSEDHDQKYEGVIYVFKTKYIIEKTIYIKIRYVQGEEVVCISFHLDEVI